MQLSPQQNHLLSAAFSPEKCVAESFSSVLKDDDDPTTLSQPPVTQASLDRLILQTCHHFAPSCRCYRSYLHSLHGTWYDPECYEVKRNVVWMSLHIRIMGKVLTPAGSPTLRSHPISCRAGWLKVCGLTFLEATANELAKHPFVTNDVALALKRFMLRFVLHSHGKTWCLPRALYAEKENY